MSTKKQSQATKSLIRLTESINQRSAYENRKLLQHERLGRYECPEDVLRFPNTLQQ